jgi:mannose-6-phosphate isomerase-like protein (cupin superfamily)
MLEPALHEFMDAVTALVSAHAEQCSDSARDLQRFLKGLAKLSLNPLPPGRRLPVCRYWDASLRSAEKGPSERLVKGLRSLETLLPWQQNPNYSLERMGAAYLENYGYLEIIGPCGIAWGEHVVAGVMLLGPETHYPPHAHPATEHYYVLSGTASWGLGNGPLEPRSPGSLIHHPSGIVHQTRTANEPLLVLYLWQGEVHVAANLVGTP